MNNNSLGEINVTLPVSEFVDRFLISVLKLSKFKEIGKSGAQQLESWIEKHQDDYSRILSYSENIKQSSSALSLVHAQLWELEDLVRSPQAADQDYFARTAKDIFSLNTDRHKLKHAIDLELPSLSFGPRLYDKGIEKNSDNH